MSDFTDCIILVTGAASGIGAATATRLAEGGAKKLILADRDEDRLRDFAFSLPCERQMLIGDVTDEALWAEADLTGLTHALVNAGIGAGGPIESLSFAEWRRVLSINLDGVFLTLQAAMRAIRAGGDGGAIVLTASAAGLKAEPGIAAYGASKAAVIHLARIAAKEGAPDKIRVNSIAPGGVETPIWSNLGLLPRPDRIHRQRGGGLRSHGRHGHAARALCQAGGDRRADRVFAVGQSELHDRCLPGQRRGLYALKQESSRRKPGPMNSVVRKVASAVLFLTLLSCGAEDDPTAAVPAHAISSACEQRRFEGSAFTLCRYDPARHDIALFTGSRSMEALEAPLGPRAASLRFAMNAGMYDDDGAPIGLYIAEGRQLRAINRRAGAGNFHLLPNGVFIVAANGRAAVMKSADYDPASRPLWATQSGPMLVIDGNLHPAFAPDGDSLHIRNGVGVDRAGIAWFAISDEPVSFGRFARLFRDALGCRNALFLDGAVSSLWDRPAGRRDSYSSLGPLVAVFARTGQETE